MVTTTSNEASTGCIASRRATAHAALCTAKSSPAYMLVMRLSRLIVTSTEKSTPDIFAISRTASCIGLPSVTAKRELGCPIIAASCKRMIVEKAASPGATILGPPLNPAKKCGSTNPVVMRMSLSTHRRLSRTSMPASVLPICSSDSSSNPLWLTTLKLLTTSSPSIATSSSGVFVRCVPVAIRIVMFSCGTCRSSPSSNGSSFSLGIGRVMSQTEMATLWLALTI